MKRNVLMALAMVSLAVPAFGADTAEPISKRFAKPDVAEVPDFRNHMAPLLGKLGCNGRACHGSFQGRGGFRLSLFGYDFKMDHDGLATGDQPRVSTEFPEESLAILKPAMVEPHKGGKRMELDSWEYNVFIKWIEGGAKNVADDHPDFKGLEITPPEILFSKQGDKTQLKVVARWSDGSSEDVTPLCRFQSNSTQVAEISETGLVTATEPGDTHVVVFYDKGVVPIPVIRPVTDRVGPNYPKVPTPTRIDELVVQKLQKLGVVPSDLTGDADFLRRVSLDLTGTLPARETVEAFLADSSPDKRARKIDELLETPAYAAWWTTRLCDITGNNDDNLNNVVPVRGRASQDWYDWIHKRVADNTPYDELVAGMVLATSRNKGESFLDYSKAMTELYHKGSEANYGDRESMPHYWARRNFRQPEDRAVGFAYTFLGIRIQCAQCHKHPFDRWTQNDFKQFTGFFSRTQFNRNPASRDEYDQLIKDLGLEGKRGGEQRRAIQKAVAEGKTVPFQEVYVTAQRPNRRRGANKNAAAQVKNLKKQIANTEKQIQTAKDNDNQTQLARLEKRHTTLQKRFKQVKRQQKQQKKRRGQQPASLAKLLGDEQVDLAKLEDARTPLMDWLRSETNPYFARAFVNRVWANYFNRGIVEPPDDLSLANPPCNKPLLDYLAKGFVENGYDMKWLHREIAGSRTYQLSWVPNETNRSDDVNFSHAIPRRLPAEVAYDVIRQATYSDEKVAAMHADIKGRAIAVPGAGRRRNATSYALQIFGRSVRDTNCDCDRSSDASLLQTVFLRNDQEVLAMIDNGRDSWLGQIRREVGKTKSDSDSADSETLVKQAYLRTLSRQPSEKELGRSLSYIDGSDDLISGLRGLLWALINTKEFIVNH